MSMHFVYVKAQLGTGHQPISGTLRYVCDRLSEVLDATSFSCDER